MKGSCHSCLSWKRCVPTNKLSWKGCAQTKVKLAQSTHTVIKYLIKNEYRAFLDRICNQWEPSLELQLLLCECGPSNAWEKTTKNNLTEKCFFVMKVEGLTHHRLHNPHHKKYFNFELKNIYNLCFNENQVRNQGNTTTDWAIWKYILYYWTFNNVHHQLLL